MDKLFRLAEMWHCVALKAKLPPFTYLHTHTHTPFSLFFLHLKRESVIALIQTIISNCSSQREAEADLASSFCFFRLCNRCISEGMSPTPKCHLRCGEKSKQRFRKLGEGESNIYQKHSKKKLCNICISSFIKKAATV